MKEPLSVTHPELAKEWSSKNTIGPDEISQGSHKKIWWICGKKHEWESRVYNRIRAGCPYCSGRKTLTGLNDLATTHPQLINEWHPKNTFKPTEVQAGSNKKIWWICSLGHEYEMCPNEKTKKRVSEFSCPYCSNIKTWAGFNDLATTHPEIAQEWSDKNMLSVNEVLAGSNKRVLWVCSLGHEYECMICNRTSKMGCGCPYCSGHKVLVGFNDFATTHYMFLDQWSDKNTIKPTEVSAGSDKKIWRKCSNDNHEDFLQTLSSWSRSSCRRCVQRISKGEQGVANFIIELGIKLKQSDRTTIPPYELDIFVPALNLAIEYNGTYWHSDAFPNAQERDKLKARMCREKGIKLIVIHERNWINNPIREKKRIARLCGATML